MRFLPLLAAAGLILSGTDAALAHPGHIVNDGHGHSHWLALFILGGLGVLAAGGLIYRLATGRLPLVDARRADR